MVANLLAAAVALVAWTAPADHATAAQLSKNVDQAVKKLTTSYGSAGRPEKLTSRSGTTVVNEVQREYNGLGQLTKEYQSASGAVDVSTTPNVQ